MTALRGIQNSLAVIRSVAIVAARALAEQNAEIDEDAATVLRHHVSDALTEQMIEIGRLIYRPGDKVEPEDSADL